MNPPFLTRRRWLILAALAAGGAVLPLHRRGGYAAPSDDKPDFVWEGIALGSGAQLRLYGVDRHRAEGLVGQVLAEVARLEKIFSLYRDDSALSRLNREGRLKRPPPDLLTVLSASRDIHRLTQGAFDPSIQPLWNFYADYFRRHPHAETPPDQAETDKVLRRVGLEKVAFDSREIRFAEPGMGLSLNGIAQGYITDKVIALLRQNGVQRALADMGEIRGLDAGSGRAWRVGIRNPQDEKSVLKTVPLRNQGFATSGGYGTVMDEAGRFTHLFDPRTGSAAPRYASISVMAETAALADALSTAFSLMAPADIRRVARAVRAKVWLLLPDGRLDETG